MRLLGGLCHRAPASRQEIEVHGGATVAQVIDLLGLRLGEVWLVKRGAQLLDLDESLRDGDELLFIPPVGGGH
ncbi:MAG: MoaD/ThiS family protein [Anaerolineae bacterium]|nr:MAG: MoaD/ThiS family protein [Anaerolineae bacterium]